VPGFGGQIHGSAGNTRIRGGVSGLPDTPPLMRVFKYLFFDYLDRMTGFVVRNVQNIQPWAKF
jgi:hypothetical protein